VQPPGQCGAGRGVIDQVLPGRQPAHSILGGPGRAYLVVNELRGPVVLVGARPPRPVGGPTGWSGRPAAAPTATPGHGRRANPLRQTYLMLPLIENICPITTGPSRAMSSSVPHGSDTAPLPVHPEPPQARQFAASPGSAKESRRTPASGNFETGGQLDVRYQPSEPGILFRIPGRHRGFKSTPAHSRDPHPPLGVFTASGPRLSMAR